MSNYHSVSVLTFICILFSTSALSDECVQRDSCSCIFSNGTGIDISPTSSTLEFYKAQMFSDDTNITNLYTFNYHPCVDIEMPPTDIMSSCTVSLALCRYVTTFTKSNTTSTYSKGAADDYLGSSKLSNFSSDGSSITYYNGPSATNINFTTTTVKLICAQTLTKLHVEDISDPHKLVLAFYSPEACLKEIEVGRSLGSTLLIVFFCLVIFYLVLGILAKKFLMGATGIEVIPNVAFWSDLPSLVRDGWAFAISGCRLPARGPMPSASSDRNTYDSI